VLLVDWGVPAAAACGSGCCCHIGWQHYLATLLLLLHEPSHISSH
jgi:hypothetical protein